VILASIYGISLFSTKHAANEMKPPHPHPAATSPLRDLPKTASLPAPERPKRWVATPRPQPTLALQEPAPLPANPGSSLAALATVPDTIVEPPPVIPSAASEPLFVSELPQGHFAHPVVSEPNLVGELRLKALIGADGSVKEVTLLSGSPKLAEVAMRAVRQWHYSPYRVLGSPVEVETQIKMSFFGQDAVSIASVANEPTSFRESHAGDPGIRANLRR
jgi:hypothetical protein